jgi:uncharacterized protein with HEPN domain
MIMKTVKGVWEMADKRLIIDYLQDILDAMEKAQAFLGEMDRQEFEDDERTAFAVIRALEWPGKRHAISQRTLPKDIPRSPGAI